MFLFGYYQVTSDAVTTTANNSSAIHSGVVKATGNATKVTSTTKVAKATNERRKVANDGVERNRRSVFH